MGTDETQICRAGSISSKSEGDCRSIFQGKPSCHRLRRLLAIANLEKSSPDFLR
jgi:hypothetical protein